MRWGAIAMLAVMLAGCGNQYERELGWLSSIMGWNRIGSSSDVWLMKFNFFGEWEKVAVVFGFMDDFAFCQEIATMYMSRYPSDQYSCQVAN